MAAGNDTPEFPGGRTYGVPRRRQEIIEMLGEAYARNDLEQDEFERRLELAEQAQTIEELEAVVADFPSGGSTRSGVPTEQTHLKPMEKVELERRLEKLDGMTAPTRFNFIGDLHITAAPAEPKVLRTVCIIGDTKVDLRPLSGMPGVFLIKIVSLIGDTRIHVPRGTPVEFRALSLIGDRRRSSKGEGFLSRLARTITGASEKADKPALPPGPTVVVTGFKLIGDMTVVEE